VRGVFEAARETGFVVLARALFIFPSQFLFFLAAAYPYTQTCLLIDLVLLVSIVATEMIKYLQQVTSSLVVKQGQNAQPASKAPESASSFSRSAPVAAAPAPAQQRSAPAPTPAPAPAPVAPRQPEVIPQLVAPRQLEVTPATIVEDFGKAASREMALNNARMRLQKGGEEYWGELFLALQNLLFRPEPELRPGSSEPYVEAMLSLPEPFVELLRKRLTPVLVLPPILFLYPTNIFVHSLDLLLLCGCEVARHKNATHVSFRTH